MGNEAKVSSIEGMKIIIRYLMNLINHPCPQIFHGGIQVKKHVYGCQKRLNLHIFKHLFKQTCFKSKIEAKYI